MTFAVSRSGWKYVVARYSPPGNREHTWSITLGFEWWRVPAPAPIPAPPPAPMPTTIPAPLFPRVPAQVSTQIITQTRTEQSVQSTTQINSIWEPPASNNNRLVNQYQPIPVPGPWAYNHYPMPPNPMGPQMFPGPSGPPPPPLAGPSGPSPSPIAGPIVTPPFAKPFVNFPPAPRPPGN
jgi:hypothetical protein